MRPMTLGEVAKAVGCTEEYFLNHKGKITSVSTDSRPQPEDEDKDSCLFVARRVMRWSTKKAWRNSARISQRSS